ncbi:hypothetical protein ACFVFS_36160 [Kitasatospora sp. NPDC057692]|uniref:hypothetical protein n=1 Tax=Kitasatospora sp. NPDC057692 TaxID=3346215 RepID=UPI0036B232F4
MRRGDAEYEAARDDMLEILRDWVGRTKYSPLYYSHLSELLAERGHAVPAHEGPMRLLLDDCSRLHSPDGGPLLSAVVVLKGDGAPSTGFYKLARSTPFNRLGTDEEIWMGELRRLGLIT